MERVGQETRKLAVESRSKTGSRTEARSQRSTPRALTVVRKRGPRWRRIKLGIKKVEDDDDDERVQVARSKRTGKVISKVLRQHGIKLPMKEAEDDDDERIQLVRRKRPGIAQWM